MKILFVNHSCSRTGAPIVLLYFLQWLKTNHSEIKFDVLSLSGGGLEHLFDEVSENHYKIYKKKPLFIRLLRFLLRKLNLIQLEQQLLYDYEIKKLKRENYQLIYHNTVKNYLISVTLKKAFDSFLILHVHELKNTLEMLAPDLDSNKNSIDSVIACSHIVANNLTIENKKVNVIYEMAQIPSEIQPLKLTKKSFVIGGSGYASKRKGVDLFIQLASETIKLLSEGYDVEFRWLGHVAQEQKSLYQELIKNYGIESQCVFLGEKDDVLPFYQEIDVFIMSSREDPFPLVCIEAGSHGVPIFLFDGTTGTQEVINDLEYLISPQFDEQGMAQNVVNLIQDETLYTATSQLMIERFSQFTIANQSKRILKVIRDTSKHQPIN